MRVADLKRFLDSQNIEDDAEIEVFDDGNGEGPYDDVLVQAMITVDSNGTKSTKLRIGFSN